MLESCSGPPAATLLPSRPGIFRTKGHATHCPPNPHHPVRTRIPNSLSKWPRAHLQGLCSPPPWICLLRIDHAAVVCPNAEEQLGGGCLFVGYMNRARSCGQECPNTSTGGPWLCRMALRGRERRAWGQGPEADSPCTTVLWHSSEGFLDSKSEPDLPGS